MSSAGLVGRGFFLLCVNILSTLSIQADPMTDLECHDGQTFGFGQLHVRNQPDFVQIYMRGAEKHGRAPASLARELGLEGEDLRDLWVGVQFGKGDCQGLPNSAIGRCDLSNQRLTFYKGWEIEQLEEVSQFSGQVAFEVVEENVKRLRLSSEGSASFFRQNYLRGKLLFTMTDHGEWIYESSVSIGIQKESCNLTSHAGMAELD